MRSRKREKGEESCDSISYLRRASFALVHVGLYEVAKTANGRRERGAQSSCDSISYLRRASFALVHVCLVKKRDRARRGPGQRTFINSKIPRPEGTAPQDAVACRTRNGHRRRCNKTGGVKSSSSVCPLVARQSASTAYRPAQRTLLACHTGSSKRTGIQRGR